MKNKLGILIFVCLSLVIATSFCLAAQHKPMVRKKPISRQDQAAIMALFKGVDKHKYRLEFYNHGKQTVQGVRKVSMADIRQVNTYVSPAEKAGWIVLIVETSTGDTHVIYVVAVGGKSLDSVLGAERSAKLQQIMAKYSVAATREARGA